MRKPWLYFLCYLSVCFPAFSAENLSLGKISTAQTQAIFNFYDYHGEKDYLMLPSYLYPPIYFSYLPSDFAKITDENTRNSLFIKILAPLALRLNQEILQEQKKLSDIANSFKQNNDLNQTEQQTLENLAKKYDVFTRFDGYRRQKILINELIQKIQVIPPSILITAAAIETNWGSSRPATQGNSLYKTILWHTSEGLKPNGETQDDSYRLKTYPSLYASMQEFALKINSSLKYKDFRVFRHKLLDRGSLLLGSKLAPYMIWNSPLSNYAGIFEYTLSYYELNVIDKSVLDSKIISRKLPPELQKLTL